MVRLSIVLLLLFCFTGTCGAQKKSKPRKEEGDNASTHAIRVSEVCLCQWIRYLTITRQARQGNQVSAGYVYRRLQTAEKALRQAKADLVATKNQLRILNSKLIRVQDAQRKLADYPPCPNGVNGFYFARHLRSCYHMQNANVLVNQSEAQRICRGLSKGSSLVSIETAGEQEFLSQRWFNERGVGTVSRYWTSGYKVRGKWHWAANSKPVNYSNWIPTTTHNDDRFNCMAVYSAESFFWGDVACWAPHMVTCEIKV